MRLSLADDYAAIYVYTLRGNQRTAGELSRKEGGKIFGGGSRSTVAIFIGVKGTAHTGTCEIFYRDIGDYLSREEKLRIINEGYVDTLDWQTVEPNMQGDWINQRDEAFLSWPVLGDRTNGGGVFTKYSLGLATNRDAWVINYSSQELESNIRRFIKNYIDEQPRFAEYCRINGITQPSELTVSAFLRENPGAVRGDYINWSAGLRTRFARAVRPAFDSGGIRHSIYRPFSRQMVYFNALLNERRNQLPSMFPTPHHENLGYYIVGVGSDVPFSALVLDHLPNLHVTGAGSGGQFFPRWTYEKVESPDNELDLESVGDFEVDDHGYRRVDNITDGILKLYRDAIGDQVTKDDIFYYVYGLLHDPAYRVKYAADLKKMLPHIPTPETRERFEQLADAGRKLAELHVGYESVDPYPLDVQLKPGADPTDRETWRVAKMKWQSKQDHSAIVYNSKVTIVGIPEDAERYLLGSRSALGWIIDRYQVGTDKASGIVNDPNDWSDEHDDPTYVVDIIKKVTTVSVETMKVVDSLAAASKVG